MDWIDRTLIMFLLVVVAVSQHEMRKQITALQKQVNELLFRLKF